VYRDVGLKGTPLPSVGEAVAISTGASLSLTRITRARWCSSATTSRRK
jgi:hypothetical protein